MYKRGGRFLKLLLMKYRQHYHPNRNNTAASTDAIKARICKAVVPRPERDVADVFHLDGSQNINGTLMPFLAIHDLPNSKALIVNLFFARGHGTVINTYTKNYVIANRREYFDFSIL